MGTRWPNAIEEAGDFGLRSDDIGQKGDSIDDFVHGGYVPAFHNRHDIWVAK
jgi:hypothetical protein